MSSFLSWVAGTTNPNNSGKSIDLFLTQLESMPKLLDKRQSVIDLYDAIKEAPADVPSSVIPRLIYVIGTGIDDEEILQKILDILCFLTELKQVENAEVLLIENVSTLLCEYSYVEILLGLFDCPDIWVRISAIQILKNCIAVNQSIVEKSILGCPMGLQKLVDVLRDKREEVRNEMLLLLRSLTRRNDEICKFIAFQDGFDILISILINEKGSISRDCLNIIYNMIVNSVLTLKLFSQKKYLAAVIDILSSYTHLVKSADLVITPTEDNDSLFGNVIQVQDQMIDLTKYNELEVLHNFDIQCFQFAISIIELLIKDDKYMSDEENYAIAKPILEQNRHILHSYSVYIFDILYFTLYQMKEEPLENLQENQEEQHRNAYDLADLANQCESLLGYVFTDSTTVSIFSDLLKITIFTHNGCFDLLSFLLNGFLESNIDTVHSQGYYTNSSIYVRLFLMLFHSNAELQHHLIQSESSSGNVLKNTWIQCITHLLSGDKSEENGNQFKLILSVYKECCKKDSSSFMKLFVSDMLTTELEAVMEGMGVCCSAVNGDQVVSNGTEELKGFEKSSEGSDEITKDPETGEVSEVTVDNELKEGSDEITKDKESEEIQAMADNNESEEIQAMADNNESEEIQAMANNNESREVNDKTQSSKPNPSSDIPRELPETHPTQTNPTESQTEEKSIKKKEKKSGEFLWILLTRLILSNLLSLDMKIELTEILCLAILNNPCQDDTVYNNLPFLMQLIHVVQECISKQIIFSTDFDTQLTCYCYLFLLLAFLHASPQGAQYLQLLDSKLGLEQLCSLSIRFFFLTKTRQFISNETVNAINAIGFDYQTICVFHQTFNQFKSALFGYYLDMSVPVEETQLIIDNYKQLIRIQDNQLQTFDLLKKGGNSGIEVIEELKKKDEAIEELKKKEVSLEQDVFDWKERFSKKEEALREKEQECEQFEYSLQTLQETVRKERETYEQSIQDLKADLETHKTSFDEYRTEKENEMNAFLVSLNKKQDQINLLDETTKEYEATISELRAELQNKSSENQNNESELKNQIVNLRNELEANQEELNKTQKKWNSLRRDYDALEDELTETKNAIMSMNTNSKEQQYLGEIEKLKSNRDDLQILVNELMEEKRMMQELVRSLSPTGPETPTQVEESSVQEQPTEVSAETFFESTPDNV